MKIWPQLVIGSVVANLILAFLAAKLWKTHGVSAPVATHPNTTQALKPAPVRNEATNPSRNSTLTNSVSFSWRQVESTDFKTYMANLRAIGCPEQTIRDIILAEIECLYEAREQKLPSPSKFWRTGDEISRDNAIHDRAETDLRREKVATLKELLGIQWNRKQLWAWQDSGLSAKIVLGFLSEPQAIASIAIIESWSQEVSALRVEVDGIMIEEDYARTSQFAATRKSELKRLLGTAAYMEAGARGVAISSHLQDDRGGFQLTAAELEQICRLRASLIDPLDKELGFLSDEEEAQQKATWEAHQEEVAAILGKERYRDYLRASDPEYQELISLKKEAELRIEAINKAHELRQATIAEAAQVRASAEYSRDEKNERLIDIQKSARAALETVLGTEAAEQFSISYPDLTKGPRKE